MKNRVVCDILLCLLNFQSQSGATPLFISSQEGKNKVVEVLLGQGANVNLPMKVMSVHILGRNQDECCISALHKAIMPARHTVL